MAVGKACGSPGGVGAVSHIIDESASLVEVDGHLAGSGALSLVNLVHGDVAIAQ